MGCEGGCPLGSRGLGGRAGAPPLQLLLSSPRHPLSSRSPAASRSARRWVSSAPQPPDREERRREGREQHRHTHTHTRSRLPSHTRKPHPSAPAPPLIGFAGSAPGERELRIGHSRCRATKTPGPAPRRARRLPPLPPPPHPPPFTHQRRGSREGIPGASRGSPGQGCEFANRSE